MVVRALLTKSVRADSGCFLKTLVGNVYGISEFLWRDEWVKWLMLMVVRMTWI